MNQQNKGSDESQNLTWNPPRAPRTSALPGGSLAEEYARAEEDKTKFADGGRVYVERDEWRVGCYCTVIEEGELPSDSRPGRNVFSRIGPRQIRVLELHPRYLSEELRCSVRVATMDFEALERRNDEGAELRSCLYEAMSYVWGSTEKTRSIKCNDMASFRIRGGGIADIFSLDCYIDVPVTENLHSMLHDLRYEKDFRTLWIDGICINQDDPEERAEQVRMMRRIYTYASRVTVWLGPGSEKTTGAIVAAQNISELFRDKTMWHSRIGSSPDPKSFDSMFPGWKDIESELLRLPWFRRTWTYQELALGQKATIKCGDQMVEWGVVASALEAISTLPFGESPFGNNRIYVSAMARRRRAVEMLHLINSVDPHHLANEDVPMEELLNLTLRSLLFDTRHLEATDPHDKIYGVLGLLLPTASDIPIKVDYGLPVRDLYTKTTEALLANEHAVSSMGQRLVDGLFPLSWVQNSESNLDLPSWVPDFSITMRADCFATVGYPCGAGVRDSYHYKVFWNNDHIAFPPGPGTSQRRFSHCLEVEGVSVLRVAALADTSDRTELVNVLPCLTEIYPLTRTRSIELFPTTVFPECAEHYHLGAHRDRSCRLWAMDAPEHLGPKPQIQTSYSEQDLLLCFTGESRRRFSRYTMKANGSLVFTSRGFRARRYRSMFISKAGFMGLAPKDARAGDEIVVLFGSAVPFVVRRIEGQHCSLVGECFVLGLMDGEALEDLESSQTQRFHLW